MSKAQTRKTLVDRINIGDIIKREHYGLLRRRRGGVKDLNDLSVGLIGGTKNTITNPSNTIKIIQYHSIPQNGATSVTLTGTGGLNDGSLPAVQTLLSGGIVRRIKSSIIYQYSRSNIFLTESQTFMLRTDRGFPFPMDLLTWSLTFPNLPDTVLSAPVIPSTPEWEGNPFIYDSGQVNFPFNPLEKLHIHLKPTGSGFGTNSSNIFSHEILIEWNSDPTYINPDYPPF